MTVTRVSHCYLLIKLGQICNFMIATLGQIVVRTTCHIKAIKEVDTTKQLPAWQKHSCHVIINNLLFGDRYFNIDRQLEMF